MGLGLWGLWGLWRGWGRVLGLSWGLIAMQTTSTALYKCSSVIKYVCMYARTHVHNHVITYVCAFT